jgi:hypothetical protein
MINDLEEAHMNLTEEEKSSNEQRKHPVPPQLFQGIHLVILQHGFLGVSYDMRLFSQTIRLLCPSNVVVRILNCLTFFSSF